MASAGPERAVPAILAHLDAPNIDLMERALVACGPRIVPTLLRTLQEGRDNRIRENVVSALGELRDNCAAAPLLGLIDSGDEELRLAAAIALREIGDARVLPTFRKGAADAKCKFQLVAIEGLGRLRDEQSVTLLLQLLRSDHDDVFLAAVRALGEIGDPVAIPALRKRLRDPVLTPAGAYPAAQALARMGQREVLERLRTAAQSGQTYNNSRGAALAELGALGDQTMLDILLSVAESDGQSGLPASDAAELLGNYSDPRILTVLRKLLKHSDAATATSAAAALQKLGQKNPFGRQVETTESTVVY